MEKLDRVYQRIDRDYEEFKNEIISKPSEEVYENAYKIFSVNEFHGILSSAEGFTDEQSDCILKFKGNILEQIYDEWLRVDFTHQDVFEDVINNCFDILKEVVDTCDQ